MGKLKPKSKFKLESRKYPKPKEELSQGLQLKQHTSKAKTKQEPKPKKDTKPKWEPR